MSYKVFISHSVRDQGLVISLASLLQKYGVEISVAEWYLAPGEPLDKKVFGQIDSSDCVVVFLTQNGIRSNWVQQEIEYALKSNKLLIPLVEKGVPVIEKSREIPRDKVADPWDRLIAATAIRLSLPLITRDKALGGIGLDVVW